MLIFAVCLMMIGQPQPEGDSLVVDVMRHSFGAIRRVVGERIYLKAERLAVTDQGLLLVCDDASTILLPIIYSDQYGCFLKRVSYEYNSL